MNTALQEISDPVFPQLATAFDPDGMAIIMEKALAPLGVVHDIISAKITDVNYDPGTRCNLLFEFKMRKKGGGRTRRQMVTVRLLKAGESAPENPGSDEIRRFERTHSSLLPGPYICVDCPRMVLSTFPFDPSMPWMVEALDTHRLKRRFSRLWAPEGWKATKVDVSLLGYTPHMRGSLQYDVRRCHRETGERDMVKLIGKTNAFKKTGKLFADSWALWETSGRAFPMPRPVGYLGAPRVTLQEKVDGMRLGGMVQAPGFSDRVVQTAEALALLHRLQFPVNARRRAVDEVKSLNRWGDVVARIRSDLRSRLTPFLAKLTREIESRMQVLCAIHADFHHTNVLVDGDNIHVIDFDEMAYGDPSVDVGRFLASLRIPTLRAFGNIHQLDDVRERFLEAYLKATPGEVARIRLFESASLLTSAASAFRIQRPNWDEEVALLLDESEAVFAEACRTTSLPSGKEKAPDLTWKERIRWAGDPAYVQAMLDRPIFNLHGVDVDACLLTRVVETRNGFKARYKLGGSREGKRWKGSARLAVSKRRGGHTTYRLLDQHYALVGQHPGVLRPPRPLAYLSRLSASITESCRGRGLHSLRGVEEATAAMERVGQALAAWHLASRSDDGDEETNHRERPLRTYRSEAHARAARLMARARNLLPGGGDRALLLLHQVRLHDIVLNSEHVGLAGVATVSCGDVRHDVAAMAAAWFLEGVVSGKEEACAAAVSSFIRAYEDARGEKLEELQSFEALALADRAHHMRADNPDLEKLLAQAKARLDQL